MGLPMKKKDVKIIEKTRPFDGYFQIDRYTVQYRRFEGGWSEPHTREVFERGHAVAVILYDPDRDELVFVEQFRIGAYSAITTTPWWNDADFSPWLIECVAGIIDEGETPESVARREAIEEAGCKIEELVPIQRILVTPGACSETLFLYCGKVDSSQVEGIHGLDEEHEDIRVIKLSAPVAFEWLEAGKFQHSGTTVALRWFHDNHRDLRARWRS